MQKTYQFLKDAEHYFIATVENDQPRVRPFGTIHIFEGKLYIQMGRKKKVAQQILANGKVEICAMKGDEWIRVSGILVDDNRREPKASMLDEYESLKSMYSADDDNTMVLYFQPGTVTATIYSFKNEPIVMKF
ncbi:MAG: NimC/NimA family protein [Lentisphaerae bacterium]|nr:NimC/NimA family protein [Lentisphaerota bacterium]